LGKIKICVIFGGNSSEHEISLISARNVINNLDKEKYEIYKIGITKGGQWYLYEGDTTKIESGEWEKTNVHKAIISPDAGDKCILLFKGHDVSKIKIDVVFLALHGRNGEDGTIQGLLELAGIPYAGPKVLSSAICMDKAFTKLVLKANNIPQADWLVFKICDLEFPSKIIEKVNEKFTYPVFVKPCNGGSSFGATKVKSQEELINAVQSALEFDDKALVEEFINAREIECAVIGNDTPNVSLFGEVITNSEFYDFDTKYVNNNSYVQIPADIKKEQSKIMTDLAQRAYTALECKGFTRVDFFIDKSTGRIMLNELNTIPGFTDISMFHMLWQKNGVPLNELLNKIIALAME